MFAIFDLQWVRLIIHIGELYNVHTYEARSELSGQLKKNGFKEKEEWIMPVHIVKQI